MKGKKIFERIVVSVLVLALSLSNVSVAADSENVSGAKPQTTVTSEGNDTDSEGTGAEVTDMSASSQSGQAVTASENSLTEGGVGSSEGTEQGAALSGNTTPDGNTAPDAVTPDGNTTPDTSSDTTTPDGNTTPDTSSDTTTPDGNTVITSDGDTTLDAATSDGNTAPDAATSDGNTVPDTILNEDTVSDENTSDIALDVTVPKNDVQDGDIPDDVQLETEPSPEEPLDLTGMRTLEELTDLTDEEVEYTIWMDEDSGEEAPALFSARPRRMQAREQKKDWSFDVYYVNQEDQHDVRHESNFNLKYQVQFRTSRNLPARAVQIKIESELLKDRDGRPVTPEDIALPYGTPDDPSTSSRTLFNYYTVREDVPKLDESGAEVRDETTDMTVTENKEYLVFFNCRSIPAGTNTAWQVLYKNLRLMDLKDESTWTLTPQIFVDEEAGTILPDDPDEEDNEGEGEEEEDPDPKPVKTQPAKTYEQVMEAMKKGEAGFDSSLCQPLTGSVNSSVSITSVVKTPYTQSGVNYTPGLYTVAQLERYIKGTLPEDSEYRDGNNKTRLNTAKYRFVVWDVKIRGQATQPWDLYITDEPSFYYSGGGGILPVLPGGGGMLLSAGGAMTLSDDADLTDDSAAAAPNDDSEIMPLAADDMLGDGMLDDAEDMNTGDGPRIVGYLNNTDRSAGYRLPIVEPNPDDPTGKSSQNQQEESWGSRFYVVTAYPADEDGNFASTRLQNNITVKLHPVDEKDEDVQMTSDAASWEYEEYDWAYKGEILGISKSTDRTRYTGWLDAYRNASGRDEDYGEMPFTTTGTMNGYIYTHETDGARIGEYRAGTYYTLTTMDDFLYAHWQDATKNPQHSLMGKEDYYFSSVTIRQTDEGYDIWEDKKDVSELGKFNDDNKNLLPADFKDAEGKIRSEVRVWAKFAEGTPTAGTETKDAGDRTVWEKIATVYMDASGSAEYVFTPEQIARMPYRVMVEHDSIDYTTSCTIDVNVRLRAHSPVMNQIIAARGANGRNVAGTPVTFENFSGSLGAYNDGNGSTGYVTQNTVTQDTTEKKGNYAFDYSVYDNQQVNDATKLTTVTRQEKYGESDLLPIRDNASRETTWLTQTAAATKTATSKNDVANSRVQVDYVLTAYDGYEIYDQNCLDELRSRDESLLSPHRTNVVFYDLLPYGVSFDGSRPVKAGVIRNLDGSNSYQSNPDVWDASQVEVSAEIVDANYRETGRILVAFRLKFTGADATSYTAGKWIEGWGVSFRAWYDWKDGGAVNTQTTEIEKANLCAFMPDFSGAAQGSNNSHPQLLGLQGEVYNDTTEGAPDSYKVLAGNIDGISEIEGPNGEKISIDNEPHVLYANHPLSDEVAVNSNGKIEKLVRADADRLGVFGESAVIPMSAGSADDGFYTYKITVSTTDKMSGIVLYDHLENAADELLEERKSTEPFPFNDDPWQGEFQSLDLSGLTLMGIKPTVYYSEERSAAIPTEKQEPSDVLTAANGWIAVADPAALPKNGTVKSVAVDLGDFTLEANQSVSIQIRMKAPAINPENPTGYYTYNHASYSFIQSGSRGTLDSRSVRVARSMPDTLEIMKQFGDDVPASRQDTSFEFRVYESYEYKEEGDTEPTTKEQPLAYAEYELRTADGSESTQITSTDGNGRLYLHAGETAVFHVANAGRLTVEETPGVFWKTEYDDVTRPDGDGSVRTVTVTNTYRPVLYVEKALSGVPASGTNQALEDYEFTFRLTTKGASGLYDVPVGGAEYWIVNAARLDGGMPTKLGSGTTEEDGTFTIRQGEVFAFFPGASGTEYELTEVDAGEDWICRQPSQTGTLDGIGESRVFTNYYKWKDLYLTKEITGQTEADYRAMQPYTGTDGKEVDPKEFTFRVEREVKSGEILPAPAKTRQEPVRNGTTVAEETDGENPPSASEKAGRTASEDGPEKYTADGGEMQLVRATGLTWVMLDAEGKPAGEPQEMTNGEFTCALGFGTVRISGLEADQNYVITEVTEEIAKDQKTERPLYVATEGVAEVKMPVFGTGRDAKIVNEYQRSTLLVTKTVAGTDSSEGDGTDGNTDNTKKEFTFLLLINGKEVEDYPYTVTSPDGASRPGRTGKTTVAEGQNPDDRSNAGVFKLAAGETAQFKDVGMRGQSFAVYEKTDTSCMQIYPSEGTADKENDGYGVPYLGAFNGEKEEASFVNGKGGNLYISKEYTADSNDEEAQKYLAEIRYEIENGKWQAEESEDEAYLRYWGSGKDNLYSVEVQGYVRMTLETTDADGKTYTWPKADTEVQVVNYLKPQDEMEQTITWKAGSPIRVYPWTVVMIPENELGDSYVLKEAAESQHQLLSSYTEVESRSPYPIPRGWLQISQSYPANDGALVGTVAEKPNAAIYNRIETVGYINDIRKIMKTGSDPVPEGSELVWRMEQYVPGEQISEEEGRASGAWIPAEGISYIPYMSTAGGYVPVAPGVCVTGADGEILLKQPSAGMSGVMGVQFTQHRVYLNLYDATTISELLSDESVQKPLLRVVEVPEKSDGAWGQLVGYRDIRDNSISLGTPPDKAIAFVNSNRTTSIRVQKSMPEGVNAPDESFTMILKQVVSAAGVTETEPLTKDSVEIIQAEPAEGVPYTIHDAEGNEKSGSTGPGGVIRLRAGEYADVTVAQGTLWTMEEDESASPNYRLASLTPDPGNEDAAKLDDNLMLIRPARERETYTVEWYRCSSGLNNRHITKLPSFKTEQRTGFVGDTVSVTEADYNLDGYVRCDSTHKLKDSRATLTGDGKTVLKVFVQEKQYKLTYDLNGYEPNINNGSFIFCDPDGTPQYYSGSGPYSKSFSAIDAETKGVTLGLLQSMPEGFLGWSEDPDATEATWQYINRKFYEKGTESRDEVDRFTFDKNTTLYAVWRAYTVSYKPTAIPGTTSSISDVKIPYPNEGAVMPYNITNKTFSTSGSYRYMSMWTEDETLPEDGVPFRTWNANDQVRINKDTTFYGVMLDSSKRRYITYNLYIPTGNSYNPYMLVERVTYLYSADSEAVPIKTFGEIGFSETARMATMYYQLPDSYINPEYRVGQGAKASYSPDEEVSLKALLYLKLDIRMTTKR